MNVHHATLTGGPPPNRQQGHRHRARRRRQRRLRPGSEAVAGSALGRSDSPYTLTISAIDLTAVSQPWPPQTLHQAFDAASGWQLSGTGPDYQCTQTFPIAVPGGGPGGPLAGHTLQCVAALVSRGAQIASIIHSHPFVLI